MKPLSHGAFHGAESQNRTGDTRFFRPVLYRLSYLGLPFSMRVCASSTLLPLTAADILADILPENRRFLGSAAYSPQP